MATARPLPSTGEVFLDARGPDRALRVTWHFDSDLLVLSLWRQNVCTASFRLRVEEVPALIELLQSGFDTAHVVATARHPVSASGPPSRASSVGASRWAPPDRARHA